MTVEAIASTSTTLAHTAIGQLTYVPIAYACGVDKELIVEFCGVYLGFHYALGSRRTTDIAKTDKEKTVLSTRVCGFEFVGCHFLITFFRFVFLNANLQKLFSNVTKHC